jgi:3-methyladenine DNA glycosylase AlkD
VSAAAAAASIEAGLRAVATAARASSEKAYLKSDLDFIGATVPATRRVVKDVLTPGARQEHDFLIGLAETLWARPVHELRMAAVMVLEAQPKALEAGDIALVERFIRESKTWALVDGLAATVAGNLVERHPELGATLDRWAGDDDFWIRRSALLAHLTPLRRGGGDWERFARYADGMLEEKEFFIRKAIGWVLREVSKKRPELVSEWLEPRAARASGVTVREAVKYLPEVDRERILAASRRPQGR